MNPAREKLMRLGSRLGMPSLRGYPIPAPPGFMPVVLHCDLCGGNFFMSQWVSHLERSHGMSRGQALRVGSNPKKMSMGLLIAAALPFIPPNPIDERGYKFKWVKYPFQKELAREYRGGAGDKAGYALQDVASKMDDWLTARIPMFGFGDWGSHKFICPICGHKTINRNVFEHFEKKHGLRENEVKGLMLSGKIKPLSNPNPIYKCKTCYWFKKRPFWSCILNKPEFDKGYGCSEWHPQTKWKNPSGGKSGSSLYESFHGAKSKGVRKVRFQNPKPGERLIKIGKLKELIYHPEPPSKRSNANFVHKFGDYGYRFKDVQPILATSSDGKQLYILNDGSNYTFNERGIVG